MRSKSPLQIGLTMIGGAAAGMVAMYLLDPEKGEKRRRELGRTLQKRYRAMRDSARDFSRGASSYVPTSLSAATAGLSGATGYRELKKRTGELMETGRSYLPDRERLRQFGPRSYERARRTATDWKPRRSERDKTSSLGVMGAIGLGLLGAGLMYLMDPRTGKRRRALIRDKAIHYANKSGESLRDTREYMRGQVRGLSALSRRLFQREHVGDEQLVARVRSALGRSVSHPHAIRVRAHDGVVTLSGPVLASEHRSLLSTARRVRGVSEVHSELEVHEQPGDVPALQGGRQIISRYSKELWAPTTRMAAGTAGGAMLVWGVARSGITGNLMALGGGALLLRSLSNMSMQRLAGVGVGPNAVSVQKDINIDAPVEKVFQILSDYESYPLFMTNVKSVEDRGNGQLHWVMSGPAGTSVELDEVLTEFVPNERICWESTPGSMVSEVGIARVDRNPDGSTRLDIKLNYTPPGGATGHAVVSMFGMDPKSQLDEGLMRLKTYIETGRAPHDIIRPTA